MKTPMILLAVWAVGGLAAVGMAQTPPDYGFTWSTITHPGNPAYPGDPDALPGTPTWLVEGRGTVNYEYRMATTELSIADWTEFVNTFAVQGDFPIQLFGVTAFTRSVPQNIVTDPSYNGPGRRYVYEAWRANNPLFTGIRWRDAALFCNWLHNGKTADPAGLWGGAYDTSTWDSDGPPFTDALTHVPGAKFWIPTQDEWMKAAFWDPAKPDRDGWWRYLNSSDLPPMPGLPGEPGATTSAGLTTGPNFNPQDIALGAYLDALSPWGLLDTASGNREWLEEPTEPGHLDFRGAHGTGAGWSVDFAYIASIGGDSPLGRSYSLRLASSIPSPGTGITVLVIWWLGGVTRRRKRHATSILIGLILPSLMTGVTSAALPRLVVDEFESPTATTPIHTTTDDTPGSVNAITLQKRHSACKHLHGVCQSV